MTPDRHIIGHNRAVFDSLHPSVYKAIVGLTIWFVASAWLLFSGSSYNALIFAMVSVFFLIALMIPAALWQTWRRHHPDSLARQEPVARYSEWAAGTFETWQGRITGAEAATQVLLPIAAVAFGLTLIGLVLEFTAS